MILKTSLTKKKKGSRKGAVTPTTFLTLFLIICPAFTALITTESLRQEIGGKIYSSFEGMPNLRPLVRFSLKDATITNVTHPMVTSRKSIVENSDSMNPK
jgi:hypothetical protein